MFCSIRRCRFAHILSVLMQCAICPPSAFALRATAGQVASLMIVFHNAMRYLSAFAKATAGHAFFGLRLSTARLRPWLAKP